MVTLKEEFRKNPFFGGFLSNYISYLYEQFSQRPLPTDIKIPNKSWKECIQLLYKCSNQEEPEFIIDQSLVPQYDKIDIDSNKVILALSGGKDSTANLVRLKDEGKDVTCYFMRRANMSYLLEEDQARKIADLYNAPMIIDELHRTGKTDYFENPIKNVLIMVRMLEYALNHNCATVSLGEFWGTDSSTSDVMYNFSDSIDFLQLCEKAIQSHIPNFNFDFFWEQESTGMSYIIKFHPEVIPLIQSCLMPTRYLNQQLKYVEKYHLHADVTKPDKEGIMHGRCMNCWKCMAEWLYLVEFDKLPFDRLYFFDKVVPTLKKKINEIHNGYTDNPDNLTNEQLLDAVLDLEYLTRYIKDPNEILNDIKHNHE